MIHLIKHLIKHIIVLFLSKRDPRISANRAYRLHFKEDIDWKNPSNLIEKIYWLEIFSDTSLWTICADKYHMREYVAEKGLSALLPKNYGHWQDSKDIDYNLLPDSFVLKTTNGCGQVLIVKDKNALDIAKTNKILNEWMKLKYGYVDAQIHYSRIKPCIIAEECLTDSTNPDARYLTDYKVWCFMGQPESILVVYDRGKDTSGYKLSVYDLNWNDISVRTLKKNSPHYGGKGMSRPLALEQMIESARILSKDCLEVRVDFYEINGRLYLGEMTFSTAYGYFSDDYYQYLGSKIDLSKAKLVSKMNRPGKSVIL